MSKDPSIYDSGKQFFSRDEEEPTIKKKKTPKEESVTLRDYERKMILENEQAGGEKDTPNMNSLTYNEEQEKIKKDLKNMLEESELETEDLFTIRKKNAQQQVLFQHSIFTSPFIQCSYLYRKKKKMNTKSGWKVKKRM